MSGGKEGNGVQGGRGWRDEKEKGGKEWKYGPSTSSL